MSGIHQRLGVARRINAAGTLTLALREQDDAEFVRCLAAADKTLGKP